MKLHMNSSSPQPTFRQKSVSDPITEIRQTRFWSVQLQSVGLFVDSHPELHADLQDL